MTENHPDVAYTEVSKAPDPAESEAEAEKVDYHAETPAVSDRAPDSAPIEARPNRVVSEEEVKQAREDENQ